MARTDAIIDNNDNFALIYAIRLSRMLEILAN
jgi:hypothetical protein